MSLKLNFLSFGKILGDDDNDSKWDVSKDELVGNGPDGDLDDGFQFTRSPRDRLELSDMPDSSLPNGIVQSSKNFQNWCH